MVAMVASVCRPSVARSAASESERHRETTKSIKVLSGLMSALTPPSRRLGRTGGAVQNKIWPVRAKRARSTGWGKAGRIPMTREARVPKPAAQCGGVFKNKICPIRAKRARSTGWGKAGRIPMTREARVPKPAAQQEVCLKRKCRPSGAKRSEYFPHTQLGAGLVQAGESIRIQSSGGVTGQTTSIQSS